MNRELAYKLMEESRTIDELEAEGKKSKGEKILKASLLKDSRFKDLFENPDFEIDKAADEYRLLHPAVSRLDKAREKRIQKHAAEEVISQLNQMMH